MATNKSEGAAQRDLPWQVVFMLAVCWLLCFSLLVFNLRAAGKVDTVSLGLIAFLVGLLLVPFVSQLSVAGLLEFKRDLNRVSEQVDRVEKQVSSLASATAIQVARTAQNQHTTINMTPSAGSVAESVTNKLEEAVSQEHASEGDVTFGDAWIVAWQQLGLLAQIYEVITKASETPFSDLLELTMQNADEGPDRAIQFALTSPALAEKAKVFLGVANNINERFSAGDELSTEDKERGLRNALFASGGLYGHISPHSAIAMSLLSKIQSDPGRATQLAVELATELQRATERTLRERA